MGSTEIANRTAKAMKVKVGVNRFYTEIATVEKDGCYKLSVDPNATYQEFCMVFDSSEKQIMVNSDECIDNMSITISEAVDGKFDVVKVPRQVQQRDDRAAPLPPRAVTVNAAASQRKRQIRAHGCSGSRETESDESAQ